MSCAMRPFATVAVEESTKPPLFPSGGFVRFWGVRHAAAGSGIGAYETRGRVASHSSTSTASHPMLLGPNCTGAGKVPARTRRHLCTRLSPVSRLTSGSRRMRRCFPSFTLYLAFPRQFVALARQSAALICAVAIFFVSEFVGV